MIIELSDERLEFLECHANQCTEREVQLMAANILRERDNRRKFREHLERPKAGISVWDRFINGQQRQGVIRGE